MGVGVWVGVGVRVGVRVGVGAIACIPSAPIASSGRCGGGVKSTARVASSQHIDGSMASISVESVYLVRVRARVRVGG